MRGFIKSIKDPIHGYVELTELEIDLLDTLPLQRLRRIKQLPGSEYVYPGAINTRFEHSLGVMHLAGLMGERLAEYIGREVSTELRAAGLLHDIGHGPFSHSFESILREKTGMSHEDVSVLLIQKTEISDIMNRHGLNVSDICDLIKGKYRRKSLSKVINSSVDADKMDYTVRDSYHTGAGYSVDIHRIAINVMEVEGDLVIHMRALEAVESLLMARLLSFRTIYYHKTSRGVQLMLELAMKSIAERLKLEEINEDPNIFLELDDYSVWELMKRGERSKDIIRKLMRREILKMVAEWHNIELSMEELEKIREELARRSGISKSDIIIDVPKIAFVKPHDLPMLWKNGKLYNPLKISPVLSRLEQTFPSLTRIYTWPHLRDMLREVIRNKGPTSFL